MKVFNTLSGQKEEFLPQSDEVKMYVCGITPYDEAHLGHAMSYIIFDVIQRYLQFRGYKVKYVQNVTDIDDKIIDRANKLGIPPRELAEKFTASYFADTDALNIRRADIYPRATEEIPKIIEIVQGLVNKGYAYPSQGSVYFRVRNVPDYGKLSHRSLESIMAGMCAVGGEEKEHPMDFVIWKASKPGEPSWESPWGPGRPGWHIECSAMSLKYLGDTIDIHGGGQDLVFPHHENEIAQSESFTGVKPFVKYWLHNGMVQLGEEKMSKSLGNLITIKEALDRYSADAIRIFALGSHYRSPLTYSEEILEAAERGAERLRQTANSTVSGQKTGKKIDTEHYRQRFIEAMDDDFNTAQAIAVLFDLAREINKYDSEGIEAGEARETLKELGGVLGMTLKLTRKKHLKADHFLKLFLSIYDQHKESKDWLLNYYWKILSTKRFKTKAFLKLFLSNYNLLEERRDSWLNNYLRTIEMERPKIEQFLQHLLLTYDRFKENKEWGFEKYIWTTETNRFSNEQLLKFFLSTYDHLQESREWKLDDYLRTTEVERLRPEPFLRFLIFLREEFRLNREWPYADMIRARLDEAGIALEDTPKGTVWKRKR